MAQLNRCVLQPQARSKAQYVDYRPNRRYCIKKQMQMHSF